MTQHSIESPRQLRLWTWDDASRIVNFLELHVQRCQRYGLDIPVQVSGGLTKDELKEKEDQLTEYFLHELRKKPVEAKVATAWWIFNKLNESIINIYKMQCVALLTISWVVIFHLQNLHLRTHLLSPLSFQWSPLWWRLSAKSVCPLA